MPSRHEDWWRHWLPFRGHPPASYAFVGPTLHLYRPWLNSLRRYESLIALVALAGCAPQPSATTIRALDRFGLERERDVEQKSQGSKPPEARNNGDAVARYDQLADRWLIVMPIFSRSAPRPDQPTARTPRDPAATARYDGRAAGAAQPRPRRPRARRWRRARD